MTFLLQPRGLPLWWQLSKGPAVTDYLAELRETGRLDAAVLQAVANVLKLRIMVVVDADNQHQIVPYQPDEATRTIHLFLLNTHTFLCYDKGQSHYLHLFVGDKDIYSKSQNHLLIFTRWMCLNNVKIF